MYVNWGRAIALPDLHVSTSQLVNKIEKKKHTHTKIGENSVRVSSLLLRSGDVSESGSATVLCVCVCVLWVLWPIKII